MTKIILAIIKIPFFPLLIKILKLIKVLLFYFLRSYENVCESEVQCMKLAKKVGGFLMNFSKKLQDLLRNVEKVTGS